MAWAGGSFTRSNGTHTGATTWAQDEAAGTGITSARHDTHDEDLADGIDNCLTKDIQNSPSSYCTWVKSTWWGGTSGGSANAQTISLSPALVSLAAGTVIIFKCGFTSTSSWTINPNGVGATNVIGTEAVADRIIALVYDSGLTAFVPLDTSSSLVLHRLTTAVTVASTAIETSLYTQNVPGNAMGTKRAVRLSLHGRMINNTGSDQEINFLIKFGSTTAIDTTAGNIPIMTTSASARNFYLNVMLVPNASATAQKIFADMNVTTPITAGNMSSQVYTGSSSFLSGYNTTAEDTSSAKTLAVTVVPSTSSASLSCTLDYACLELL